VEREKKTKVKERNKEINFCFVFPTLFSPGNSFSFPCDLLSLFFSLFFFVRSHGRFCIHATAETLWFSSLLCFHRRVVVRSESVCCLFCILV